MTKFLGMLALLILVMLLFTVWAFSAASQLRPECIGHETWSYNPSTKQCYLSPNTCAPRGFSVLDNATGCDCDNLYILNEDLAEYYRDRCLDDNR